MRYKDLVFVEEEPENADEIRRVLFQDPEGCFVSFHSYFWREDRQIFEKSTPGIWGWDEDEIERDWARLPRVLEYAPPDFED